MENLNKFIEGIQKRVNKYYEVNYDNLLPSRIHYTEGVKYIRVIETRQHLRGLITEDGQSSVLCFVDKTNGNVLFPKGWSSPETKNPRGNINSETFGLEGISESGTHAIYLRG